MRLIDANALDRVLEDFENRHAKSCFVITAKAISKVRQIVYAMKDVDAVEVVHGRWVDSWHEYGFFSPRCSACHQFNKYHERYNYCPNCGAKMDGDGNAID